MRHISSRFSSLLVAACFVSVVGCGPRGESHTLDQIFADARGAYSGVASNANTSVGDPLKQLNGDLERLAGLSGGGDAREISKQVADGLAGLTPKAGVTQRASLTELANQYRVISSQTESPVTLGNAQLKLLVARTYQLLASEISTTNFRL